VFVTVSHFFTQVEYMGAKLGVYSEKNLEYVLRNVKTCVVRLFFLNFKENIQDN
jgi:hypothetical protein